jgi:5-formyltetrahydrofolate cyclo-ligase
MWGTGAVEEPIVSDKSAVRAGLLARRAALGPAALADASLRVLAHLGAAVAGRQLVAAYVPIGTEPGGPGLPDALRNAGARVLLPVLRADNDLDWAAYDGVLEPSGRGLREPPGPRLGVDAVASAELIVVPALAVDRRGVRLGRGGGSYDRALTRVPAGAPIVALLHDGELLDELPAEPHDRLVSGVIMPSGRCDLPDIS